MSFLVKIEGPVSYLSSNKPVVKGFFFQTPLLINQPTERVRVHWGTTLLNLSRFSQAYPNCCNSLLLLHGLQELQGTLPGASLGHRLVGHCRFYQQILMVNHSMVLRKKKKKNYIRLVYHKIFTRDLW